MRIKFMLISDEIYVKFMLINLLKNKGKNNFSWEWIKKSDNNLPKT